MPTPTPTPTATATPLLPAAIVAADRSRHFLDRPYPSDELLTPAGTVDLGGFPRSGVGIGDNLLTGWANQVRATVFGFPTLPTIYFRFEAPVQVATGYDGLPSDAVRVYSLDSDHRVPVGTRLVADPLGDPYQARNTLIVFPREDHPLHPGERYVALVDRTVARPAAGWSAPPGVADDAAVATLFTVHDCVAELRALGASTDAALAADPSLLMPPAGLRAIATVRFSQGQTPSGRAATLNTVTFADGGSAVSYLSPNAAAVERTVDLTTGPMAAYEATIQTLAFQDPAGRPYQTAGIGLIGDWQRSDGWIHFARGAALRDAPHPEPMRVVILVPRAGARHAVLTWAHGSGGSAYEPIQRVNQIDDLPALRQTVAEAGAIIVSADLPLFGTRFPLIDSGFSSDIGFINVANLAAYRDNVRQGAVDQRVLHRFATEALPSLLGADAVDPSRVGAFGHSTGSQVLTPSAAMQGAGGPDALLLSGAGGFISHYIVGSEILGLGGSLLDTLFFLVGVQRPAVVTPAIVIGALFGVPESAWPLIDRHHPLFVPFQLLIDGGDPLAYAGAVSQPATVFRGTGDTKVPADSAAWLAAALPAGELLPCVPSFAYDGHYCALREPSAFAAFADFIGALR